MNDTTENLRAMPLEDAPIGLFVSEGEVCLKTEYVRRNGSIDAYIVSSGEAFWGPLPQTVEHQRKCLVVPFDLATALERLEAAEQALRQIAKGEGRYSLDPLIHASNTIEDMKAIAAAALVREGEVK